MILRGIFHVVYMFSTIFHVISRKVGLFSDSVLHSRESKLLTENRLECKRRVDFRPLFSCFEHIWVPDKQAKTISARYSVIKIENSKMKISDYTYIHGCMT